MSLDREAIAERIRRLRPALAASGVTHVALFGSRSRGDHRQDSDVDLLIEVEDGRRFSLLDLIGVQHTIGDDIGLPVSALMRRSLSGRFKTAIAPDVHDVF